MNTNHNRFQIDYLTMTVFASEDKLQSILQEWNADKDIEWLPHGARGYERMAKTVYGLTVYVSPVKQKNIAQEYFTVELSSTAVQKLAIMHVMRVVDGLLKTYRVNITRLDLACDTQAFRVRDFWNYIEDANDGVEIDGQKTVFETRFHRDNIRRIVDLAQTGDTVYVGSRDSTAMLRVYKKLIEGDELFKDADGKAEYFTRVELELHDARALASMYKLLMASPKDWHYHFVELLNGMMLLGWSVWNDWLGSSSKWWLRLIQAEPNYERSARWIRKQVAPTLAMLARCLTPHSGDGEVIPFDAPRLKDYFLSLVREGDKRLTVVQKQVIALSHQENLTVDYHDRKFTGWGAKYDDLLVYAAGRMKIAPSTHILKSVDDWIKKNLMYLSQVELPGVEWDEYTHIKNWTHYEI